MTNGARFAARPLTVGGTPAQAWIDHLAGAPELDLHGCTEIVVVAAHPDDETLGFGASAATLAGLGVRVQVVSASDGGASNAGASALQRRQLEQDRRAELHHATEALGLDAPICLGLPDGELSDHEDRLADQISETGASPEHGVPPTGAATVIPITRPSAAAAVAATERVGTVLLEYPVWMWHWASPGDDAVPWDRLHAMPLTDNAVERKAAAARLLPHSVRAGRRQRITGAAALRAETTAQVREVVFR